MYCWLTVLSSFHACVGEVPSAALFEEVGCAVCHIPSMELHDPVFSEPSQSEFYRDAVFPSGDDPAIEGLSPATAIIRLAIPSHRSAPWSVIARQRGNAKPSPTA